MPARLVDTQFGAGDAMSQPRGLGERDHRITAPAGDPRGHTDLAQSVADVDLVQGGEHRCQRCGVVPAKLIPQPLHQHVRHRSRRHSIGSAGTQNRVVEGR